MTRSNDERAKQKTQPKGKKPSGEPHEPIEIPVPKRGDVDRLLRRAARGSTARDRSRE